MGNMVIWRQGAFADGELYADLSLGTTRGTDEFERFDPVRIVGVVREILERDTEGADQRLGSLGRFGVEDLESQDGVLKREGE